MLRWLPRNSALLTIRSRAANTRSRCAGESAVLDISASRSHSYSETKRRSNKLIGKDLNEFGKNDRVTLVDGGKAG